MQSLPTNVPELQQRAMSEQRRNGQDENSRRGGYQNNRGRGGKGAGRPKKRERDDEEFSDIAKQWADKLPGNKRLFWE